jgi:hypothetical protein
MTTFLREISAFSAVLTEAMNVSNEVKHGFNNGKPN